jgi:outer membrane cobalamin receptor
MKKAIQIFLTGALMITMITNSAQAQEGADLIEISLEDLMNMEITSISKKAERLQEVASSIYVVTSDELIKSGATTLHEVLRNVPGYWGTQEEYSVVNPAIRNSKTVNEVNGTVLYLLDGTPIQDLMTSSFSFKNFDLPIDEIDRIEVIRGSGGTIYGANSATGVINIFTKNPDKYDGIHVRTEGATPGFGMVSARGGGKVNDKLSLSGYGKVRFFSGFESFAGKDLDGESIGESRFNEDYERSTMFSLGFKSIYEISDRSKVSLNTHYNSLQRFEYTNVYESNSLDIISQSIQQDVLFENDVNTGRFVGNIRYDQEFSDNHSLFVRLSTNSENDFVRLGGGFNINNSLYDIEIQDNLTVGEINDISIGGNFRLVNFDISDINSSTTINYFDAQAQETLTGGFIQNRLRLFDNKLNFTVGVKAENFSLVNDQFYFSPMAKVAFVPNENLTFWGGFTQSFSTPGFNNTNVELFLFQTPSLEAWTEAATLGVFQEFYGQYLEDALGRGLDQDAAEAEATQRATDFIATDLGQQTVNFVANDLIRENPNFAVKNGSQTEPSKFQSFELGGRMGFGSKFSIESNFFYNIITDYVSIMDINAVARFEEAVTQPGRSALWYLYGNYTKGNSIGMENMIRTSPMSNLTLEFSHSWVQSEWEFQENDDFDINNRSLLAEENVDRTPDVPFVPEHIFRLRGSIDLPRSFNISTSIIQTTKFRTEASYRFEDERYQNIISSDLEITPSTDIAPNDSRTIVNLRIEKSLMNDNLSIYLFGNDIFNDGIIANTNNISNVTVSQIAGMYGIGLNYRLK